MRILAEQLLCIDDMAGTSRPPLAAAPRQTARADEIRPRDADERRTIAAARNWLPAETIVLVLAAAIALAFVAGFYVFRDVHLSGNGSLDPGRDTSADRLCLRASASCGH
jgi:hypothetical protein